MAIAWRGNLNITSPQIVFPHRAVSVELHTHDAGDVQLVCVYGDVIGTWKAQSAMWKAVSKSAAASGKPFIWGGDWDASNPEVQDILGSMNIPAVIMAPQRATCVTRSGGSVIDFFVVHRKASAWCQEVQVYKEGHSAPHRPSACSSKVSRLRVRWKSTRGPPL